MSILGRINWCDMEDSDDEHGGSTSSSPEQSAAQEPIICSKPIVESVWFVFADEWDYSQSPFRYVGSIEQPNQEKLLELVRNKKVTKWFHAFDPVKRLVIYRPKGSHSCQSITATGTYLQKVDKERSIPISVQRHYPQIFTKIIVDDPVASKSSRSTGRKSKVPQAAVTLNLSNTFDLLDQEVDDE